MCYTKLMFYWEFEDISKFLGIVLNAICSQVQSERLSDDVFVSKCVGQTFVSHWDTTCERIFDSLAVDLS